MNKGDFTRNTRLQVKAAFKENLLDHMVALDPNSEVSTHPLTKMLCNIGPLNCNVSHIETLIEAGLTTILLSMWMFNQEEKIQAIRNVRQAVHNISAKHDRVIPLGVGIDLRGPQIHTGRLFGDTPVNVETGSLLCLTTRANWENSGTASKIYIDCQDLPGQLIVGTDIMIDSGKIMVNVASISGAEEIICNVLKGGMLFNNTLVQVIGTPIALKELTNVDLEDIEFAIQMGLDFIFVPSVRFDCIIRELRKLMDFRRSGMLLIAKISNKIGVSNIESIVREADAISLVRDSLSIEMTEERIFIAQDNVTAVCKMLGKPILIEGNMLRKSLYSSTHNEELDVMDIVTSLQKGADGFILRDTIKLGDDVKKIMMDLVNLCVLAEPSYWHTHFFNKLSSMATPPIDPAHAISIAVVEAAMKAGAAAILVCTNSGLSAKLVCRYLPRVPVIAITRYGRVARQLSLYKAAVSYHYIAPAIKDWHKDIDLRFQAAIGYGKERGFIKPGDPLVLLNGWRPGAGFTNTMRMTYASQTDPWVSVRDLGFKLNLDECPTDIDCPYHHM